MTDDHSFFDDFFGPMYDQTTGTAKCLDCEKLSKDFPGQGRWISDNTWVCADHATARDKAAEAAEAEIETVKARVLAGNHTNADLDFLISKGVATQAFDDPDSNRPTGIRWL